jgi:glycosyltransferase involved in cell wall biosynthesis
MREYLRRSRVYLYTGTQPASYTLGLIEALMTGIPIVSIGPELMGIFPPYGPSLFEGQDIVGYKPAGEAVPALLKLYLDRHDFAAQLGAEGRVRAIELFGRDHIAAKWLAYLGQPAVTTFQREAVTA